MGEVSEKLKLENNTYFACGCFIKYRIVERLHIFNFIAYGVRFNSISVYLNIKELNYVKKNEYVIIKKQSTFGQILVVSSLNGA